MKKMKRILAAGLMLLALAGCGTSDNQAAEYPAMWRPVVGSSRILFHARIPLVSFDYFLSFDSQ